MESVVRNGYVSVSEFSRGNTARIFKAPVSEGEIVVMKNNQPIRILSLPKEKPVGRQTAGQQKGKAA